MKGVALEESVVGDNERWIPSDTFMLRDVVPLVGMFTSTYRMMKETYHFCGSLIKGVGRVPSRYPSHSRGIIRICTRGIEGLGIISYNCGIVYLIQELCDLANN